MIESKSIKNNIPNLNNEKLEFRDYQIKIANKCLNKNSLVVIPTGLGKTIIAVITVAKTLEYSPTNSKIVIMAPTRPLINQHYESFLKFLSIPEDNFVVLTGKINPENRAKLFREKQVIFYTPQTLRNDLVNKKYSLDYVCLLIFDEAHHASGDYPYTLVADEYMDQNPDGNILALTASPGSSRKKITRLCRNLHIPVENIHIRTRKDSDVKEYLKPMDVYKIGSKLSNLMEDVYGELHLILENRLQFLNQNHYLNVKTKDQLFKKVIRKNLIKLHSELISVVNGTGDKTGAFTALTINAQALIIYHMLELVEQQGLDILLEYLESLNKKAKKKDSSKARKRVVADPRIRRIYIELKNNQENNPKNLIHPKYHVLEKILHKEIEHNSDAKILVFVKLRDSVRSIVEKLKMKEYLRPSRFVGQANKSKKDKGLSQKRQIEILNEFREGIFNVLVSTNVGEEGLDIAECDLVIFFDVVVSEIRVIQRKGRTARHREGKVVILYCKGTKDEKYLEIALNNLKKMNVNLKRPKELRRFYEMEDLKTQVLQVENEVEIKNNNIMESSKVKKQYNLNTFIDQVKITKATNILEEISEIKINKSLSMKYGIRKKLSENNILFDLMTSDNHIELFNEIVINVYLPNDFNIDRQILDFNRLSKKYKLVISILDFIDYKEEFEGETDLLRKKITESGKENNIHIILINNYEEFIFIIKNLIFKRTKK